MAMSKETCTAAGAELFRIGLERPEGSSWQAKAMQQGYDCAQTDAHDAKQDEKVEMHKFTDVAEALTDTPEEAAVMRKEFDKRLKTLADQNTIDNIEAAKHPAVHHLEWLESMFCDETNEKRRSRLCQKIVKLASKWADRGVIW